MKHIALAGFTCLLTLTAVAAQGIDIGLSLGPTFYEDITGVLLAPEARYTFTPIWKKMIPSVGVRAELERTANSDYREFEISCFVFGGIDWPILTSLPEFSSLARLGVGGGYLDCLSKDSDSSANLGLFLLTPSIGASYNFGCIKAELLAGPRFEFNSAVTKTTIAMRLGALYHF